MQIKLGEMIMEIHSVQELINTIEKLESNYTYSRSIAPNTVFGNMEYVPHFIYRGHSNHEKYTFLPGVLREETTRFGTTTKYSQLEYNILSDFISEACRYVKDIPITDIPSWLEIAQHFGVPTRLMDFTKNPLVALYFACSDTKDVDGSIWIINEPTYNKTFFQMNYLSLSIDSEHIVSKIISDEIVNAFNTPDYRQNRILYPWIYKPNYKEERMNLQSSIFMIWGAKRGELTSFVETKHYMTTDDNITNKEDGILCYIKIPADYKEKILKQLNLCGINQKFVYPGLEGVGRFISTKYSAKTK